MAGTNNDNEPSAEDDVFNDVFPAHLQRLIGAFQRNRSKVTLRAALVLLIGWLPLFLLTALQSALFQDASFNSFLSDYGTHARSLIAAPLLAAAESISLPHLSRIVAHFGHSSLITEEDRPAFLKIIRSTLGQRNSFKLEIAMVVLAIGIAAGLEVGASLRGIPDWHRGVVGGISWAGWWTRLVSIPLLFILLVGWIWRYVLWAQFLFRVSRLNLQLLATHPDQAAGLKFLGGSLNTFSMPIFCIATAIAGGVANQVVHHHRSLSEFQVSVPCLFVFLALIVVAPLCIFSNTLVEVRRQGILSYGGLARDLGLQMERKWLTQRVTSEALAVSDFSSTTDLYAIVANAYGVNILPLAVSDLVALVLAALLPFIPVVLLVFPFSVVIRTLAALLQ